MAKDTAKHGASRCPDVLPSAQALMSEALGSTEYRFGGVLEGCFVSMNSAEYTNLERVESAHWYYAGKRELVRRWLRRAGRGNPGETLLDCGAGTGRFAVEMSATGMHVLALDDHEESLAMLRQKLASNCVLRLGDHGIPLPDASVDVVTALDVLEHIQDDSRALADMLRVLKPGGYLLATVPARMELWSDWDIVLQHHRRYTKGSLRDLFERNACRIVHLNYTNVCVYPLVWLIRSWQRSFPRANRAEDRIPWAPLNVLLRRLFVWTGLCRIPWPRGVSLLILAVKR